MRENAVYGVEVLAEHLFTLAKFIRSTYPVYVDGHGDKHFVPGPATTELRKSAKPLIQVLKSIRSQKAHPLPPFETNGK